MLATTLAQFPRLWPIFGVLIPIILLLFGVFLLYIWLKYVPKIAEWFVQAPPFQPVVTEPDPGGEDARFRTADGYELVGTYYPNQTESRLGVVVFCHEFLADRHSVYEYVGGLREAGFDLFAFDFRNHGDSQSEPGFNPLHWVTDRELTDLRAALDYLRSRPDADPAGVALFGVSRGGGAALCVAAADPTVWAVATDGAFPTRSTMMHYVYKWAHVLVRHWWLKLVPKWLYRFAGSTARVQASRRRSVAFPRLERAVPKIPPRPWLAIHGSDDSYVPTEVVEALVRRAGRSASTQLWLVPEAKHNRCREVAPDEYRRRVVGFFVSAAPRLAQPTEPATEVSDGSPHVVRASKSLVVPQGKR